MSDRGTNFVSRKPACVAIPDDTMLFMLHLSNSEAEGMNNGIGIESEVATINFAPDALGDFKPHVRLPSLSIKVQPPSLHSAGFCETWCQAHLLMKQLTSREP